ncbi:MAG: hypothetical protein M1826_007293 [Phylliscum demangeonii]|nr:MAG: hypothetical protein M1826_007293 [Phylliscum demangeonii]
MVNQNDAILASAGDFSASLKSPAPKKRGLAPAANEGQPAKRVKLAEDGEELPRSLAEVASAGKKRMAAAAELDAHTGKSARPKKVRGWKGVGEEKGLQRQRPRAPSKTKAAAKAAPKPGSSKPKGEGDPPTLREIGAARIGRTDLGQLCFYHFSGRFPSPQVAIENEAGRSYPYLLTSDHLPIASSSPAALSVLMYMVFTGVEALADVFPKPAGLQVPTDLSADLQRTGGQTAATNRSRPESSAGGGELRGASGGANDEEIALQLDELGCFVRDFWTAEPTRWRTGRGVPNQHAVVHDGKDKLTIPFISFSNSGVTEAELAEYKLRRGEGSGSFPTKAYPAQKRLGITHLENWRWTNLQITERLRRSGRTARQDEAFLRVLIDAKRRRAVANRDAAAVARCDAEMAAFAVRPTLVYGTTLAVADPPSAPPKKVRSPAEQRGLQIMEEHRVGRELNAKLAAHYEKEGRRYAKAGMNGLVDSRTGAGLKAAPKPEMLSAVRRVVKTVTITSGKNVDVDQDGNAIWVRGLSSDDLIEASDFPGIDMSLVEDLGGARRRGGDGGGGGDPAFMMNSTVEVANMRR